MYWIKRCYLDGVGYHEAFYRHQTFELFPEGWEIRPDNVPHTYLDLVNGGGKTTWVSFIMTVFDPQKNKFIQCVAGKKKNKNYHYNDYFHDQLSTILIEMVDDQNRALLLGQYHQKHQGKTEVIHFICDHPDTEKENLFDQVPSVGRAKINSTLSPHVRSLSNARHWLTLTANEQGYWRCYSTRKEWHNALNEVNINLEMINSLITINSEEGGVSHFANYRSEQDFLEKFYACCMSSNEIESLAKSCEKQVEQGCNLDLLVLKKDFRIQLRDQWQQFEPKAHDYIQHKNALGHTTLDLAEHLRDMVEFKQVLNQRSDQIDSSINQLNLSIREHNKQLRQQQQLKHELDYRVAEQDYHTAKTQSEEADLKLNDLKRTEMILNSVKDCQEWLAQDAAVQQLAAVVEALQTEQKKPLVDALHRARQQAKRIFDDALFGINQRLGNIKQELKQCRNQQTQEESLRDALISRKGEHDAKQQQLKQYQEEGEALRLQLEEMDVISPNELPENTQHRLNQSVEQALLKTNIASKQLTQAKAKKDAAYADNQHAQEQWQTAIQQRDKAVGRYNNAITAHDEINIQLRELAINSDANAQTAINEQLHTLKAEQQSEVSRQQNLCFTLKNEIDTLTNSGHLLVDHAVREAVNRLHEQGLSPEQVWAFPEYLAKIFTDDADRIATVIDQDPGRYLGVAVMDESTLERVKKIIASIEWHDKPVPIYMVHNNDTSGSGVKADAILSSKEKFQYSEQACKNHLEDLKQQLLQGEQQLASSNEKLERIQATLSHWQIYWQQTGQYWQTIYEEAEQSKADESAKCQLAEQATTELTLAEKQLLQADNQKHEADGNYQQLLQKQDKIEHFLNNEWKKHQQAEIELPKLQTTIRNELQQLEKIEQELSTLKDQISQALSAQGELNGQQQTLTRQLNISSFKQDNAAEEVEQGLSPEEAKQAVQDAEQQLRRYDDNPEVKDAYRRLQDAKTLLDQNYSILSQQEAWQKHEKQVRQYSAMDPVEFERRYSSIPPQVEQAKEQTHDCREKAKQSQKAYEQAKINRPASYSVDGDYNQWKTQLSEIAGDISRIKQTLNKQQEQLKYSQKEHQEQNNRRSVCDNLIWISVD